MLYSFSQASYTDTELARYFQHINENDAVLLWQNGVLLALKYAPLLHNCKAPIYALDIDIDARNLGGVINPEWRLSLAEMTKLTESVTPVFSL